MAVDYYGDPGTFAEPNAILSISRRSNLTEFRNTRRGTTANTIAYYNSLTIGSTVSADFPNLTLDQKAIVFEDGGQAQAQMLWVGTDSGSGDPVLPLSLR